MKKRITFVIFTLILVTSEVGCFRRNPTITTQQQVVVDLAKTLKLVAIANEGVTRTTMNLVAMQGITPQSGGMILVWCRQIAKAGLEAEKIVASSKSLTEQSAAVRAVFLKFNLPPEVEKFMQTPTIDQGVLGIISAIRGVQLLVLTLQGKGGQ